MSPLVPQPNQGRVYNLHKIILSATVLSCHPLSHNEERKVPIIGPRFYKAGICHSDEPVYLKNNYESVVFCINIILICHIV